MNKKLIKHGNSFALLISKQTLKSLNINEATLLNISISGNSLIISPTKHQAKTTSEKSKKTTRSIAQRIMKTHNATFKKLAKT